MRKFFSALCLTLIAALTLSASSVKVYFENTANWSQVYLFTWTQSGDTPLGAFPGLRLTEQSTVDGREVYVATADTENKIIFSAGNDGDQTADLHVVEGKIYTASSVNESVNANTPTLYLRGECNGWGINEKYKFSVDSNGYYSLTVPSLDGEFKIADDKWDVQYGAPGSVNGDIFIKPGENFEMACYNGANWNSSSLTNVTLKFKYQANANLTLSVEGEGGNVTPIDPIEPADFPVLYLRGTMTDNWSCRDQYRFAVDASGNYTLTIPSLNGEFKISDSDWKINYGAPKNGSDNLIVAGKTYVMSHPKQSGEGDNWRVDNLANVTLRFTYSPDRDLTLYVEGEGGEIVNPTLDGLSGTLPVLYINVYNDADHTSFNNEVTSYYLDHKNYFTFAEYWLDINGCAWAEELGASSVGSQESPLPLQIKARGNWTRKGFSKKPFKLKLDKKQSLLGMSKSKHYAILAHADDTYGYLRNFIGFNLGQRIGLPWTPSQQPVEVVINGNYRGIYFLTESIRVEDGRVEIEELEDGETDPKLISGGYLVELDNYDEDNQIQMEEKGCVNVGFRDLLRITYDTPEEYSELQRQFVRDQFSTINDAIGINADIVWSYLDLDDAARYYIVEEIVSHTEAYHGSTYLFRDRGEGQKWHFSPLWDFGNAFNGPTNDFFYNHGTWGNTWIASIRQNAKFNNKVRETWVWFMQNCFDGLYDDINTYVSRVKAGAEADYKRWHNEPTPADGQQVADNRDMNARADAAKNHLSNKIEWLKNQFGNYSAMPLASEPARDTTPAAPLPDYVETDVLETVIEATTETIFFDINGHRIGKPVPGMIVIERKGGKTRKLIVK